jgi:hypothetical protein
VKRRDVLAGHTERIGRRDLGARHHGGFHAYATTVACSCGWTGTEIEASPSQGGSRAATVAHQAHIDDWLSRDPELTLFHARTAWRDWRPGGNGMTYRIKICRIEGGLADCDKILLVNVGDRTWAFQFAVTQDRKARLRINEPFLVPLKRGVPPRAWADIEPLLKVLEAI